MTKGLFTRTPQKMTARFADFLKECAIDEGVLELCEALPDEKVKVWGYFLPVINKIVWDIRWTIDKSEDESLDELSDEDVEEWLRLFTKGKIGPCGVRARDAFLKMFGITANDDVSDLRQHGFYDSISEDSLKEVVTYLVPQLYAAWIKSSGLDHQRGYQIWQALNIYDPELADLENYLVEDERYFYYFHLSQYDAPGDDNVVFTHYCNSNDCEPPRCFSLENRQFTDWKQRIKTKPIVKFVMDKGVPGYTFKSIYIADTINKNGNFELKSI